MRLPLQDLIKTRIERWLNCKIYRYSLPRGVDFAYDAKEILKKDGPHVIFDVGANIGQSVVKFRSWYPASRIYSFEPVTSTYAKLSAQVGNMEGVSLFQIALGDENGEKWIHTNDDPVSSINSFVRDVKEGSGEKVKLNTLDSFCEEHAIAEIDVLKIDVEGFELQALKGCDRMLSKRRVKALYIETALRDDEEYFVPLTMLDEVLRPYGFDIFGIYEQQTDIKRKRNHLYFCNVAYVRQDLIRS